LDGQQSSQSRAGDLGDCLQHTNSCHISGQNGSRDTEMPYRMRLFALQVHAFIAVHNTANRLHCPGNAAVAACYLMSLSKVC
jgi:hypothetical protein